MFLYIIIPTFYKGTRSTESNTNLIKIVDNIYNTLLVDVKFKLIEYFLVLKIITFVFVSFTINVHFCNIDLNFFILFVSQLAQLSHRDRGVQLNRNLQKI